MLLEKSNQICPQFWFWEANSISSLGENPFFVGALKTLFIVTVYGDVNLFLWINWGLAQDQTSFNLIHRTTPSTDAQWGELYFLLNNNKSSTVLCNIQSKKPISNFSDIKKDQSLRSKKYLCHYFARTWDVTTCLQVSNHFKNNAK
jgi:hypothetical protein